MALRPLRCAILSTETLRRLILFDLFGSGPDAFFQPLIVLPLVVSHNFERKNRIAPKGAGRYHDRHEGGNAGHFPHRVESGARA